MKRSLSANEVKKDDDTIQEISYDMWPQNIALLISPSKKDKDSFKLQAFDRTKNAVLGNSKITRDELFAMHESKALHKYPVFLSPELDTLSQSYFSGEAPDEICDSQALVLYRRLSQLTYSESKMDTKALFDSVTKVEERLNGLVKVSGFQLGTPVCVQDDADNQKHPSLTNFATNSKSSHKNEPGICAKEQIAQKLKSLINSKNAIYKRVDDQKGLKKQDIYAKDVEEEKKSVSKVENNGDKPQTKRHIWETVTNKIVKIEPSNEKHKSQAGRKELKKLDVKHVYQQPIKNTKLENKKLLEDHKLICNKAMTDNKELLKLKAKSKNQNFVEGMTDKIQKRLQDDQKTTKEFLLQTNRKEVITNKWKSVSRKVHAIFQNSKFVQEESSSQIKIDNDTERVFTVLQSSKTDTKISSPDYLKNNVDQASMIIRMLNMGNENSKKNQNIMGNEAFGEEKNLTSLSDSQLQNFLHQVNSKDGNRLVSKEGKTPSYKEGNKDEAEFLKSSGNLKAKGNTSSESHMENNSFESDSLTQVLKVVSEKFLTLYMGNSRFSFEDLKSKTFDQHEIINDNYKLQNDRNEVTYISGEMSKEEAANHVDLSKAGMTNSEQLRIVCNEISKVFNKTISEDQLGEILSSRQNSFPECVEHKNEMDNYNSEELIEESETMSHDKYDWHVDNMEFQYSEELIKTANINEAHPICLAMKKLDKHALYKKEISLSIGETKTICIPSEKFSDRHGRFTKWGRVKNDLTDQEDNEEDVDKTKTTSIHPNMTKTKCLKSHPKRVQKFKSSKPQEILSLLTVKSNHDEPTKKVKESKLKSGKPKRVTLKNSKPKAKSEEKSKDISTSVTDASSFSVNKKALPLYKVKKQVCINAKSSVSSVTYASKSCIMKKAFPSYKVKKQVCSSAKSSVSSVTDASKSSIMKKSLPSYKVRKQVCSSAKSPVSSVTDASKSSIMKKVLPSYKVKKQIHSSTKYPVQRNIVKTKPQLEEKMKVRTSLGKNISIISDNSEDEETDSKINICKTKSSERIKQVRFAIKEEPELQSSEEEIILRKRFTVPKMRCEDFEIIRPVTELNYSSTCILEDFKHSYAINYLEYVTSSESSESSLLEKDSSEFEMITKQLRPPDRIIIPSEVLKFCGVHLRAQFRQNPNMIISFPKLLDEINFREIPLNAHLFEFFRLANEHSFKIFVRPEVVFPGTQMNTRLRLECYLRNERFVGSVALLPLQFDMIGIRYSQITAEYIEDAFQLTRLPKWLVRSLKRFFNVIHLRFIYHLLAELAYETTQEPASMSLDT